MRFDAECIFCRVARGDVPGTIVYQDEHIVAFRDIQPAAPVHVLVIPREHIASIAELQPSDAGLAGALLSVAAHVAALESLRTDGYRVVSNVGRHGGQSVDHLHLHVLGGRVLGSLG